MKEKRIELYVGLFLAVGIAVLGGLILNFGKFGELFRKSYPLTLHFEDAGGLVKDSPVQLGGVKIGRVAGSPSIDPETYDLTIVELEIYEEFQIPTGSTFSIGGAGFLGDALVQVRAPDRLDGTFVAAGSTLDGESSLGLSALASSAESLSNKGEVVLEDIRTALGDLGSAITKLDRDVLREENLRRFDTAMTQLTEALEALNGRVLTDENTESFRDLLANLKSASANLDEAALKVGPLLQRGDEVIAKLEPGLQKLADAAAGADAAIDQLNTGDGLLRALLEDESLKEEVELFVSNLRRNGILRYKDNAEESTPEAAGSTRRRGIFGRP